MIQKGLNNILPVMGLNKTDSKKTHEDQDKKPADTKELLAMSLTEGAANMVTYDDWNGLSTEDGMELKIIQPKSSRVCYIFYYD